MCLFINHPIPNCYTFLDRRSLSLFIYYLLTDWLRELTRHCKCFDWNKKYKNWKTTSKLSLQIDPELFVLFCFCFCSVIAICGALPQTVIYGVFKNQMLGGQLGVCKFIIIIFILMSQQHIYQCIHCVKNKYVFMGKIGSLVLFLFCFYTKM